jgi:periplasmic protein TonB
MKATLRLVWIALTISCASAFAAGDAPDTKPVPVRTPQPEYPAQLRFEKKEGTVVLIVTIDEKGDVSACVVSKSTDARFETAAVDAVRKWRFKPATKSNSPVSCSVTLPIHFSVES